MLLKWSRLAENLISVWFSKGRRLGLAIWKPDTNMSSFLIYPEFECLVFGLSVNSFWTVFNGLPDHVPCTVWNLHKKVSKIRNVPIAVVHSSDDHCINSLTKLCLVSLIRAQMKEKWRVSLNSDLSGCSFLVWWLFSHPQLTKEFPNLYIEKEMTCCGNKIQLLLCCFLNIFKVFNKLVNNKSMS
jgi:hypothetical protein